MKGTLFLGKEGHVEPLQGKTWKDPFYIGIVIVIIYTIYEAIKLHYFSVATAVVYINYGMENALRVIWKLTIATMILVIISILIAAIIRLENESITSGRFYTVMIIIMAIMLVTSIVLAAFRFIIDAKILKCATLPWYEAWMYQFMNGTTVIFEWLVAPDLVFNGALVMGIILVLASTASLYSRVDLHASIMETGLYARGENVTIGNNSLDLDCKIKNGIKACTIG